MSEPTAGQLIKAFAASWNGRLEHSLIKIRHCLGQLSEEQVWWRPDPCQNSIANVLLHLMGNLRQWVIEGVGGKSFERDRPGEFADSSGRPMQELLDELQRVVDECLQVISALDARGCLEDRRIQGFEVNAGEAITESVSHFVGHTHQVILLTRLQLGEAYRFEWAPSTPEQGV